MGSNTSKLRKALQRGEEVEAMQIYLKNPEIKRNLDPGSSYGDSHDNNTALHYASLYAMKHFIRSFLVERGNPNKRNDKNQTAIHCICTTVRGTEETVDSHRAECLGTFLQWRGRDSECIELDAVDQDGNTALHYAALSGLLQCVQLLVANRASLYIENNEGLTACDCAIQKKFNNIAAFLETKMVFSDHGVTSDEIEDEAPVFIPDEKQEYRGLCEQDLQEAKDQLLVETADMLRVPLFTAEALLRNYEWSREHLVEGWMSDPTAACEKAGVKLPPDHCADKETFQAAAAELNQSRRSSEMCDICADNIDTDEVLLGLTCGHEFCRGCWESYLNLKIKEGDAHHIQCPMYACNTLVPQEIIESLVSKEMATRYLKFDIKAFVESNPNLKWCPAPRCGRAVRLPPDSSPSLDVTKVTKQRGETAPLIVDCGHGHYFCWYCLSEAHEPCSCEQWQRWLNKIAEMLPKLPAREHLSECPETEVVANTLWLVTNSKSCPNCKSPIEKNEGCNHVKCTKCKYEFCWVCLEQWKLHSSATGGYFRCNRFEVVQKLVEDSQKVVNEVSSAHKKIMELNYFLHYYSRFKNHENSYKLEEPLLGTAKGKMVTLALAAQETALSQEKIDTSFIEDAVSQLLTSRRVLRASYGYGFFLIGNKDKKTPYEQEKKTMFELMQTEVEEATETVSQMVARPYLMTPRSRIIQSTQSLQRKRKEFLLALSRGLIPDEEPRFVFPSGGNPLSRLRLHFSDVNDESDEDEENYEEVRRKIESSIREQITRRLLTPGMNREENAFNAQATSGGTRMCTRKGCERPQSVNRLSGLPFEYCSLECQRCDHVGIPLDTTPENRRRRRRRRRRQRPHREEDIDLLRAIQLSLQEERNESSSPKTSSQRTSLSSSSESSDSEHAQLDSSNTAAAYSNSESEEYTSFQRAIELSIQANRDTLTSTQSSNPQQSTWGSSLDYDLRRAIELSLQENPGAEGGTPHSTNGSNNSSIENENSLSNRQRTQQEDAESSDSDEFLTVL